MELTTDASLARLWVFLGLLAALAALERLWPGPNPPPRRSRRWPAHAALIALDTLLARVLVPAGAFGVAIWAESAGVGVFNVAQARWPSALPSWLEWGAGLLLLDAAIYWQHRWLHRVPWLWRLHRAHHTDATLDATSALRFHPLEMLVSLAYKAALIAALGVDPAIVLVFETLLSSFALITHANLALPARWDRALRWWLVTPAMHRIHHSVRVDEQHRNYGFHTSLWDRVFGSYAETSRDAPQAFGLAGADVEGAAVEGAEVEGANVSRSTDLRALLREPFRD